MIEVGEGAVGAAPGTQDGVHLQAIVPREHQQQAAGEHRQVAANVTGDVQAALLPPQARRQRVEHDDHGDDGEYHRQAPVEQRQFDRKLVDEERQVFGEVRVGLTEGLAHPCGEECAPVTARPREQHSRDYRGAGRCVRELFARDFFADVQVAEAARQHQRDDALTDGVEVGEHEERRRGRARGAQQEQRPELGLPHLGRAHGRVPEVVRIDLGDAARDEQRDRAADQEREQPPPAGHAYTFTPWALSQPSISARISSTRSCVVASNLATRIACVLEARMSPQPSP